MKEFGLKICLFLFLATAFSGNASELGAFTVAATGTILLWPLYRKVVSGPTRMSGRKPVVEERVESAAE